MLCSVELAGSMKLPGPFFFLVFSLVTLTTLANVEKKSYADHTLWRLNNLDAVDSEQLIKWEAENKIDLWLGPMRNGSADVLVQAQYQHLLDQLRDVRLERRAEDVKRVVEESYRQVGNGSFDYDHYFQQQDIYAYLQSLVDRRPDVSEALFLGPSHEGRDIYYYQICGKGGCDSKPSIWIDAAIHAREWIAPSTAVYIMEQLLVNLSDEDSDLVDKVNWFIVPILNVDGYAYSFESDRYWRKSRALNAGSSCVGTDTNRNFDFKWAFVGTSTDPCSQIFHGSEAFSDVEIQHVRDVIGREDLDFKVLVALHSYGNLVLLPYGYTDELYEDYEDVYNFAIKASEEASAVHGTTYEVGTAGSTLYKSSGTARDWGKGAAGIKYTFTVELRGDDFVLPPQQIRPTAEETWAMVRSMAKDVINEFVDSQGLQT